MAIDMQFGVKEGIKHFFRQQEEYVNASIFNDYLFGDIEYQDYDFDTDYVTVCLQLNIEHEEEIKQMYLYFEKQSYLLFADEEKTFFKQLAKMIDLIYSNNAQDAYQAIKEYVEKDRSYKNVLVVYE